MMTTFSAEEIPDDLKIIVSDKDELRCPHWTDFSGKIPYSGKPNQYLIALDLLNKMGCTGGKLLEQNWYDIKTWLSGREEMTRVEFLEYLKFHKIRIGKICNRMFCKGGASLYPQEFKCPNCEKKTVFKRL
uniref:Uncharacterized protein n=1 Tax=viral metagenome TaxID=1070528 RepID=A0A6H1ZMP6_9ZZZZ